MPPLAGLFVALLGLFIWKPQVAYAQSNVTIQDVNPRVSFQPSCSPITTQCSGAWWAYNFTQEQRRTITYGPSANTRFAIPSASFTFNGTAIYYYAVASGRTASVSIALDGGPAQLVNITEMYDLNYNSEINYPVFAWSATNLDPSKQHTFFLEFAEPDPSASGKWAGFDSIVYTSVNPATTTPQTSSGAGAQSPQSSTSNSRSSSINSGSSHNNGAMIGGVAGAAAGVAVVLGVAFFYFCIWSRRKRIVSGKRIGHSWAIDGSLRRQSTTTRVARQPTPEPPMGSPVDVSMVPSHISTLPGSYPSPLEHDPFVAMPMSPSASTQTPTMSPTMMLDPTRPESIMLLFRQQQEIMELLRRQHSTTASSSSPLGRSTEATTSTHLTSPTDTNSPQTTALTEVATDGSATPPQPPAPVIPPMPPIPPIRQLSQSLQVPSPVRPLPARPIPPAEPPAEQWVPDQKYNYTPTSSSSSTPLIAPRTVPGPEDPILASDAFSTRTTTAPPAYSPN
ncbi:hypothetical protein FRB99_002107 [Tulasnella sp. 403]|nr:hypothetical protein FRB99_002107 [Tulasnella sp. 403]